MGKSLYKEPAPESGTLLVSSEKQAVAAGHKQYTEASEPQLLNVREGQPEGNSTQDLTPTPDSVESQTEAETLVPGVSTSGLERTGEVLDDRNTREHLLESRQFESTFSEDDEDWQAKTNFTDFLQLHENAHLIELHKIICSTARCQLIGQFEADHKKWEEVINEMKEQDWWNYTGTSSSSSTRDGVTYFNLFVNKPEN